MSARGVMVATSHELAPAAGLGQQHHDFAEDGREDSMLPRIAI